jgi:pilus assembly protein CpaF
MANNYLISVLGGKGGVGKSIFSTNLALSFLLDSKKNTIILDADPDSYGDLSLMLGLKTKRYFTDAIGVSGKMNQNMLREFVSSHQSGLSYSQFFENQDDYEQLGVDTMHNIIDSITNFFPFTVVDCGNRLTPQVVSILEKSTVILVVTNPELIVLKHTKNLLEKVSNLMFHPEMVKVILNKYDPGSPITPQIVQTNLSVKILGAIHDDVEACVNSLTKGKPAIISEPKSLLARNTYQIARVLQERGILESLRNLNKPDIAKDQESKKQSKRPVRKLKGKAISEKIKLKRKIHKALIDNLDLKKMDVESKDDPNKFSVLYEKTKRSVIGLLEKEDLSFLEGRDERANFIKSILDEALALGPLEDLLARDDISEIMVNGSETIYVEQNGRITLTDYNFTSSQQLIGVIERILAPIGRRIDEKTPYTDARLRDGSRVHAIIPPLAIDGPTLTIRKFKKEQLTMKDLVNFGTFTQDIGDFFKAAIESRLNVLISGGTGSGKTTLLNVLSAMIPTSERIITVEDSAELQLQQDHLVRLETRPPNIEGEGEVTIRDLVKCTLRMRPDRIIVGECRSGEALDMLQAMNTGHDGSLTTVHSNTPEDCVRRLETLVMMAGMDLPAKAIREQIASAVHLIIQQTRLSDGSRKITKVTEVSGLRNGEVMLNDIFQYKQLGVDKDGKVLGKFLATGYIPKFIEALESKGINIPKGLFSVS